MARDAATAIARFDDFTARAERRIRDLQRTDMGRAAEQRRRAREGGSLLGKIKRAGLIAVGIAVAALLFGMFISPLGINGFFLLLLAIVGGVGGVMFWPKGKTPEVKRADLNSSELGAMPVRVERWLEKQRHALPSAVQPQVDEILLRLEVLGSQLAKVGNGAPVAGDARRLISDHLPRLVDTFLKVEPAYRAQGSAPVAQLVEGLDTISGELQRLSEQLAKGDLDAMAVEGKFLEQRYREADAGATGEARKTGQ